jgi:cell division protein FtsB
MLRINLLPAYIAERRKTRTAIAVSTALFALVCAGLMFLFVTKSAAVATREQEATDEEQKQAAVEAIKSKTTQIRTQIAPLQDKVNFVENVRFYNTLAPSIYRNAARYTIRQVEYNSMKIAGSTLTIGGFVSGQGPNGEPSGKQSVQNFGRYLITFFGNPDITALSVAGLPGYPSPATGTGTAAAGSGGIPGGFPGRGGFPGAPSGFPGGPGGIAQGGDVAGAPGDLGQSAALGQLPSRPGFPFTATATLKHPVVPPTVPASAGGGTAAGGFAGAPGVPPPGGDPGLAAPPPPDVASDSPPPP